MFCKKTQCIFSLICFFVFIPSFLFSQTKAESLLILDDYASQFVFQGIKSYEESDWDLAIHFFRRATGYSSTSTEEIWYMLIMAEMYAEKYSELVKDAEEFNLLFPYSSLGPYVKYQLGRAYYYLKQWDSAISILSDFCVDYPKHELYSSSLFWIAETLYAMHYYSLASSFYERIVDEYPKSVKMTEVMYRLDVIHQREKEEKLLLLLQATSEEYLSSKEDYERQIRQFQTEEAIGLRKQLSDALAKIVELENEIDLSLEMQEIARMQGVLGDLDDKDINDLNEFEDFSYQIQMLKEKAYQIRMALDEKSYTETYGEN